jgi:hypothetical protein
MARGVICIEKSARPRRGKGTWRQGNKGKNMGWSFCRGRVRIGGMKMAEKVLAGAGRRENKYEDGGWRGKERDERNG